LLGGQTTDVELAEHSRGTIGHVPFDQTTTARKYMRLFMEVQYFFDQIPQSTAGSGNPVRKGQTAAEMKNVERANDEFNPNGQMPKSDDPFGLSGIRHSSFSQRG
jgi:hypothetical protein